MHDSSIAGRKAFDDPSGADFNLKFILSVAQLIDQTMDL